MVCECWGVVRGGGGGEYSEFPIMVHKMQKDSFPFLQIGIYLLSIWQMLIFLLNGMVAKALENIN